MYIYIYTHIYIYMYIERDTYIHIYIYTYTYIPTYLPTCIHTCMHACIHTYMHACMHAYIHTYICVNVICMPPCLCCPRLMSALTASALVCSTPNLPTNIMDFRGSDSSVILLQRGDFQAHREFPIKFDSSNVGRRNVSSRIGRTPDMHRQLVITYLYRNHIIGINIINTNTSNTICICINIYIYI